MKKILISCLTFLLLCAAVNAYALSAAVQAVCGASGAATCTTPTGDELTESFGDGTAAECWSGLGGTTCSVTWTVAAGTPTIADVPIGSSSNTACTKGLSFDASSAAVNIYKDLGAGTIANNVQTVINFSMYIDSSSLAQYTNLILVSLVGAASMTSTTSYVRIGLNKSTTGTGSATKIIALATDSCVINFAEDTWYNITVTLDAAGAAGGSSISDGTNSCTFQRDTDASRYVYVGASGANVVGYIGNLRISTP